jgi:hypothetical protein
MKFSAILLISFYLMSTACGQKNGLNEMYEWRNIEVEITHGKSGTDEENRRTLATWLNNCGQIDTTVIIVRPGHYRLHVTALKKSGTLRGMFESDGAGKGLEIFGLYARQEIQAPLTQATTLIIERMAANKNNRDVEPARWHDILQPATHARVNEKMPANLGRSGVKDTALVNEYLRLPTVKALLPATLQFAWCALPDRPDTDNCDLYALQVPENGIAPIGNTHILCTQLTFDYLGRPAIHILFTPEGGKKFESLTATNIGRKIFCAYDGYGFSTPVVQDKVTGNKADLAGQMTAEEVISMTHAINLQLLPFHMKVLKETVEKE